MDPDFRRGDMEGDTKQGMQGIAFHASWVDAVGGNCVADLPPLGMGSIAHLAATGLSAPMRNLVLSFARPMLRAAGAGWPPRERQFPLGMDSFAQIRRRCAAQRSEGSRGPTSSAPPRLRVPNLGYDKRRGHPEARRPMRNFVLSFAQAYTPSGTSSSRLAWGASLGFNRPLEAKPKGVVQPAVIGRPAISRMSFLRTASAKRARPSAVRTKLAGPPMISRANAPSTS